MQLAMTKINELENSDADFKDQYIKALVTAAYFELFNLLSLYKLWCVRLGWIGLVG